MINPNREISDQLAQLADLVEIEGVDPENAVSRFLHIQRLTPLKMAGRLSRTGSTNKSAVP
jgi:hypothetical protein